MGDPEASRRSRGVLLLTVLGLCLATACGSGAVLWLAAHVLTHVPDGDVPVADVVDLFKVALAPGCRSGSRRASGPPVIDDLAALVRSRPAIGATRLVTLDGHSGAGKTRLAGRLARVVGHAPVVHLDFFYPGWDGLAAGVELAVDWVARPLAAGRPARWRRYDWTADRFAEWHETPCAPVVVLEGCGVGSAALRPFASTAVWVDTAERLRNERLRARIDWSRYAPHRARWAAQEEALFAVERPWEHADVIVDNGPSPHCRWPGAG